MKKLGISIIILLILCCDKVKAETFNNEKINDYQLKLSWIVGANVNSKTKTIYIVTDKDGNPYYNVEPNLTYFTGMQYTKDNSKLDDSTLKKISKIIHYGYGYKNHTSKKYYIATQYLIFKELKVDEVIVVDNNRAASDYVQKEIEEIENKIKSNNFIAPNISVKENSFILSNPYIIENFNLEGENIKIIKENNSYKIELLNNLKNYEVKLKAKNNCLNVNYWYNISTADLLGDSGICEEDQIIKVEKLVPEEKEEEKIAESKKEIIRDEEVVDLLENNEEYQIEEKLEIEMPSTQKYSISWLLLLVLLGNLLCL